MARKTVDIVFFDKTLRKLETRQVLPPTTNGGALRGLTIRCNDIAWNDVFTHWVQPSTLDTPTSWLVFECMGSARRNLIAEKPTKEAAEMWLVSCA